MHAEKRAALETVCGHLTVGDIHVATVATGGHEVLESILRLFEGRERPPIPEVVGYVDPLDVPR